MEQSQVVIAVDMSGSMPSSILDGVATRIEAVGQIEHRVTHVLWFDTKILYYQKLKKWEKVETPRVGGWGTDAECVFRWIKDHSIEPSTVFIITDGCLSVDYKYTYDTAWVITDEFGMFQPAFGYRVPF